VRARVADIGHAQREKSASRVEGEFEFRHQIAALVVAGEAFRTRRSVFDRPVKFACGPQYETEFWIHTVARAEIAADIVRKHANSFRIHAQHFGKFAFLADCSPAAGINRVAPFFPVELRDSSARFHWCARHTVDVEIHRHDMRGGSKNSIGFGGIAKMRVDEDVAANFIPDRRRTRLHGVF
jgi:hypothetical protein